MFREPTAWQRYGPYLAAGAVLMAGQSALLGGLLLQRRRRRAAEQETRRAEDRFRSIVETQSDLVCRFLPDTTLTFVNEAYCRFFNSTPDRLLGTKFILLIPEGERENVRQAIAAIQGTESHEHSVVLPDGAVGWQHWTNRAVYDDRGQLVELQGMGLDITDRRRTEDALRAMEARNSAFLKALPDMMFVLERDGTYVDFHARDPRLLFVEPGEFLGRSIRDVMPPALGEMFMEAIERVWTTDDPVVIEYELPVPEPRHFETRIVRAEGGRLLSIVRDVTEAKQALADNRDLVGRLIISQEVERQRIARELHDDLSQKIALLNIDLDQFAAQANVPEFRSRLQDISVRAGEIASDVHHLSHELHPSKLQTLGLVAAIRSLCRDISGKGALEVEFVHHERELVLDPDASLCLYRITQEALHNITRHSRARHASVQLLVEPPDVRLYIADSGVGFDPKNGSSLGLGLVSMRERVGLLRGQIVIHSRPGEGTRVGVRLPLKSGAAAADLVAATAGAAVRSA
jgi:PAS domain S-box-containing protein